MRRAVLLAFLVAILVVTAGQAWLGRGEPWRPPMQGRPAADAGAAAVRPATSRPALEFARERCEAPPPQTAARPATTLRGELAGIVPGFGEAWAVEAYRLTAGRTAVVGLRRSYVAPDGRLTFADLDPGPWQLAIVAPRFSWGPLVLVGRDPAPVLRLDVGPTGDLHVETIADRALPVGTTVSIMLAAVRSPALRGACVSVQRVLETRTLRMGESASWLQVSCGVYELRLRAAGESAAQPLRRLIDVAPGAAHVRLGFGERAARAAALRAAGRQVKDPMR